MNQLQAFRDTVRLAEERGVPDLPGSALGLAHLRQMAETVEASDFSDTKLGRWLGWAQCAAVAANVGITLDDMIHALQDNAPQPPRRAGEAALADIRRRAGSTDCDSGRGPTRHAEVSRAGICGSQVAHNLATG